MDHILDQIIKITLSILKKHEYIQKHWKIIDNLLIRIYANETESRITFKQRLYLRLLTSEMMKLLKKITKAENGKNVPHLKITEVALVYYDIVNNDYEQGLWVLYTFVSNKLFGQLSDISHL